MDYPAVIGLAISDEFCGAVLATALGRLYRRPSSRLAWATVALAMLFVASKGSVEFRLAGYGAMLLWIAFSLFKVPLLRLSKPAPTELEPGRKP